MAEGPLSQYREQIGSGKIRPDQTQALAVEKLQSLHNALKSYEPLTGEQGWRERFGIARRRESAPQGLYFYGGVGRGKSMLMDLFFEQAPLKAKRRVHFHAFMQEVHTRMAGFRVAEIKVADPINSVAQAIAKGANLLCLDELQITDITDAMIVGRLFEGLFKNGVVVVATSNRPPRDLYKDGLQREQFIPFIMLIESKMDLLALDGPIDYRLEHMRALDVYMTPNDALAQKKLEAAFERLTHGHQPHQAVITVQGRKVEIPKAVEGVAMVSFTDICGRPLGAADYIEISRRYHTLIMSGIPRMNGEMKDVARRFITLIDALYEGHVKFICSADGEPNELYSDGEGAFEFERTSSRLVEMQSESYIEMDHESRK
ncbi:MAG: cell division protein ZapE, partial [Rhodospirillaceae bacterium]|nr:cell division protein ZapE [Rhodospirillaceae bacterium]